MNLYSLLNIEHTSNLDIPSAEKIELILNEILSPQLNKLGYSNKSKKYIWQTEYNPAGIKKIIQFTYRGTTGNFFVGTNFRFIPFITQNKKLAFYNHKLHALESSSFFDDMPISLWNETFFRKSLKKYLDKNLPSILTFLNNLETLGSNIGLVERQLNSGKFHYAIQDPNLKYVLAYLYNELGNIDDSKRMKTMFLKEFTDFGSQIFKN